MSLPTPPNLITTYMDPNGADTQFVDNNTMIDGIYNKGVDTASERTINNMKTSTNDYNALLMNDSNTILNKINTRINTIGTSLSAANAVEISNMDVAMTENISLIHEYDEKRNLLENKLQTYNSILTRLENATQNKYYILFIVWTILFFIILFTLFFNIIEEQSSMNLFSKGFILLFILFILYYILKNSYLYLNGYK